MPHQLAAEHLVIYDVLRAGYPNPNPPRTGALIAAAISAIGSTPTILCLTFYGDGVYSITANLTIPATITLMVPPGVSLNVGAGVTLTVSGPMIIYNLNWRTGTGTFVFNQAATTGIGFGQATMSRLNVGDPQTGTSGLPSLVVGGLTQSGAGAQPMLQVSPLVGTDGPVIDFVAGGASPTETWRIRRRAGAAYLDFYNVTVGQGTIILGGLGVGMGNILPTHILHVNPASDDAFKGTTLWSVPSDARLKTILGDFTDGLTKLQALPRMVRFVWNGKAQTGTDGPEQVGWIAQEATPVAPELFKTYEDKLEPEDEETTTLYTGNYSSVLFMLVNAVKELAAQVEALTARVAELEGAAS